MPEARRTEAAERDLQDIAFHIAGANGRPAAADRVIDELISQSERFAERSAIAVLGTAAPELGKGVRLLPYKRWVILFRYERHGVDILRFADGSQD